MRNLHSHHSIYLLIYIYFYYHYIIFMYKCTFIDKYFTHHHKMLVGELESNMDYVEHRPFPHYFDFGYLQGD